MRITLLSVLIVLLPAPAVADRISRMTLAERCVYTAQLSVAGYHYFLQGKPRGEVPIRWHGDETQNEVEFVNHVLDQTYATAERHRRDQPDEHVSEQAFGDHAYETCMQDERG